MLPVPEWRDIYDHLRAAEGHIRDVEELLRVKSRHAPRLRRMREEIQEMLLALRAAPVPEPPRPHGSQKRWQG